MTEAAQEVLAAFGALTPAEQQEEAAGILRRVPPDEDLPTAAVDESAADVFRCYDGAEGCDGESKVKR